MFHFLKRWMDDWTECISSLWLRRQPYSNGGPQKAMSASEWQTSWPSMSRPNEEQNDGVKLQLCCDRLLRRTGGKIRFQHKWPFCPHQIFAEGCQCSTSHHPRALGNLTLHQELVQEWRWYTMLTWRRSWNAFLNDLETLELELRVCWIILHFIFWFNSMWLLLLCAFPLTQNNVLMHTVLASGNRSLSWLPCHE